MKRLLLFTLCLIVIAGSCRQGTKKASDQADTETFKQYELSEIWRTDTVLKTPESVVFDEARNMLYVSNMNGDGRTKDGNGFISKISPDGKIAELIWVSGMHAPKGMAVINNRLYVADISELIEIDINNGEIVNRSSPGEVKLFNDITSDPEGNIYITDMDSNIIYQYSNGNWETFLATGLNAPNGLLADGNKLLVAQQLGQDFRSIDMVTKDNVLLTGGINRGDGIASTGVPGHYLVSDWEGEVFLVYPDNSMVSLLKTKDSGINSADIWFIPSESLLLVPTFSKQSVVAYKLSEKP